MSDRLSGSRIARIALVAVALLLAGCAGSMEPGEYTEEVQSNYRENCVAGSTSKLGADGAASYCQCTYDGFVRTVPFDDFKAFERYLRDNVGDQGDQVDSRDDLEQRYSTIVTMLDDCVPTGPAAPATTVGTTTTTR